MSIFKKIIKAYKEKRLFLAVNSKLLPYIIGLKYIFSFSKNIKIHNPNYIKPNTTDHENEIVERVFRSYKFMKNDEIKIDIKFKPSKLWIDQLNNSYKFFHDSLKENNVNKFHFFLTNYGSWKEYHGISNNTLIRSLSRSYIGRRYLENVTFKKNLRNWKWLNKENNNLSDLEFFRHGNQSGAFIDDKFIIASAFFNEFTASILSNLLTKYDTPNIAELGGGDGNFIYYLLKKFENFRYFGFDLPEVISIISYNFLLEWPDKKFLLYGEESLNHIDVNNYDFILMPSWEIANIKSDTIDLFINKNSLGEMTKINCESFIHHICRTTEYFFHMNHDNFRNNYDDGEVGVLSSEFPIDKSKFELLFRYPDLGHLMHSGVIDYYMDIFLHLYKKRK